MNFVSSYREISKNNKYRLKNWFWTNFNFTENSIYIGKLYCNLPESDDNINNFLLMILNDFNTKINPENTYLKIYFSKNVKTGKPEINYIIISTGNLDPNFNNTLLHATSEQYKLTKDYIDSDDEFRELLDHYLIWRNYYKFFNLINELSN